VLQLTGDRRPEPVSFMTNESGDDLIVAFAIDQEFPGEVLSLILMRTANTSVASLSTEPSWKSRARGAHIFSTPPVSTPLKSSRRGAFSSE
jgi:hypothetical protein